MDRVSGPMRSHLEAFQFEPEPKRLEKRRVVINHHHDLSRAVRGLGARFWKVRFHSSRLAAPQQVRLDLAQA
jgi:hypothetical protein